MTGLPDTLDVDDDGYPDDARLEQIRTADSVGTGGRWLIETFPELAKSLGYASCEVTDGLDILDHPEKRITFSTGGWSGCEDFIAAVLGNLMINMMFYYSWQRGGHYELRVRSEDCE